MLSSPVRSPSGPPDVTSTCAGSSRAGHASRYGRSHGSFTEWTYGALPSGGAVSSARPVGQRPKSARNRRAAWPSRDTSSSACRTRISVSRLVIDTPAHEALALKVAEESMVLLKNDGLLPLNRAKIKRIAVIGANANDVQMMYGNYNGTPSKPVTPLAGIKAATTGAEVQRSGS